MSRGRRSAAQMARASGSGGFGNKWAYVAVLTAMLVLVLFSLSRTGELVSQVLFGTVAPAEGSGNSDAPD